jgi:hypothetical protein
MIKGVDTKLKDLIAQQTKNKQSGLDLGIWLSFHTTSIIQQSALVSCDFKGRSGRNTIFSLAHAHTFALLLNPPPHQTQVSQQVSRTILTMSDATIASSTTSHEADVHRCSNCGEPAKLTCASCKDCPFDTEFHTNSIFFCSKECQKDDWKLKHRAVCKSRVYKRSLHRAANLAQEIFYELREKTFDDRIVSVTDEGDILRITNQVMGNHVVYHDFPDMSATTPEDKATVLTYCTCNVTMATMFDTVVLLFRGMSAYVK